MKNIVNQLNAREFGRCVAMRHDFIRWRLQRLVCFNGRLEILTLIFRLLDDPRYCLQARTACEQALSFRCNDFNELVLIDVARVIAHHLLAEDDQNNLASELIKFTEEFKF